MTPARLIASAVVAALAMTAWWIHDSLVKLAAALELPAPGEADDN